MNNTLPAHFKHSKPARDFKPGDVIRYPKPVAIGGFYRFQIVEYIGIGRYGYDYKVIDLATSEPLTRGFGSQTKWEYEGEGK